MADVHITKPAAAQRQINSAIRILFSQEDPLTIHTIVAAAYGILSDLSNKDREPSVSERLYTQALETVRERFPKETSHWTPLDLRFKIQQRLIRNPANFLKHANQDPDNALNPETLKTDHVLLEACALYVGLGVELTFEMRT